MTLSATGDFGIGGIVCARAAKPATAEPAMPATTLRRVGCTFMSASSRGAGLLAAPGRAAEAGGPAQAGLHVHVFAFGARLVAAGRDGDVAKAGIARDRLLDDVDAEPGRGRNAVVALLEHRRRGDHVAAPGPIVEDAFQHQR